MVNGVGLVIFLARDPMNDAPSTPNTLTCDATSRLVVPVGLSFSILVFLFLRVVRGCVRVVQYMCTWNRVMPTDQKPPRGFARAGGVELRGAVAAKFMVDKRSRLKPSPSSRQSSKRSNLRAQQTFDLHVNTAPDIIPLVAATPSEFTNCRGHT